MKRILKKIAISCCVLFVVGIVCMAVGMEFGGQPNYAFNLKTFKVYVPTDEQLRYVDKTVDVEAFDSLDAELGNVDIEVRRGENYQVQYHLPSLDEPVIEVNDKKLVIRNEEDEVATFGWSFGIFGLHIGSSMEEEQKKMIVTIPENVKLEDMKVSSEFGEINMADIQVGSYDIKADSGTLSLENMETETGTVLAEFGNITIHNLTGETGMITANSGDCSLDTLQLNQLSVTAEYGEVELRTVDVKELAVEAASGNVSLEKTLTETGTVLAEYGDVTINNMNGGTCTITAQSGECELEKVQLDSLNVVAEYGSVKFSEIEAEKLAINAESGDITINDMIAKTSELTAEYGNVTIENAVVDDMDIVCESGNCNVGLIGNAEEYDMDITVDAGNLKINGEEQGDKYKSIAEKEKSIVIQSEYGDVEIAIE